MSIASLVALTMAVTPIAAPATAFDQDQIPNMIAAAADSISAIGLARHLRVISANSTEERVTPSPGLARAARYVAGQFKQLGVLPNRQQQARHPEDTVSTPLPVDVEDTAFFQRYPLVGNVVVNQQPLRFTFEATLQTRGKSVVNEESWPVSKPASVLFSADAFFATDTVPLFSGWVGGGAYASPQTFVVSGPQTVQSLHVARLQGKLVLYVPHQDADAKVRQQLLDLLRASNYVLIASNDDSATFAVRRQAAAAARQILFVDYYMQEALGARYWAAYVRAGAIRELLDAMGIDLGYIRTAKIPMVHQLPLGLRLDDLNMAWRADDSLNAVNVIGVIPGSDARLKNQYIMYSAHVDHATGATAGADNAAGVAGLIELAKAFSQPGARPKRSILFVALSGGAKDFSGANYFVQDAHHFLLGGQPFNIKIGPIGRNSSDSVTIDGLDDFEFAPRPDWIAARHSELNLAVAKGETILTAKSDHLVFVRAGLPSLYFHSGNGTDVTEVDPEHAVRVLRLAFYVGQELANADMGPSWTPASRRERVRFFGD